MESVKLDNDQIKAITDKSDRILCLAGAGSGKTECLVRRVINIINNETTKEPQNILVLTFTHAAADEMRRRYDKYSDKSLREFPMFKTFHAFCYWIICNDYQVLLALGYKEVPEVATDEDEERIKREQSAFLKLKHHDHPKNSSEEKDNKIIDAAAKKYLKSHNLITYDMMSKEITNMFINDYDIIKKYKKRFKHILVDEFQDTDPLQVKFLNSFDNSTFYVSGDALQNLYSWRGTSNEYIKAMANSPEFKVIKIGNNYRSTTPIVEYANKFAKNYADESYRVNMTAHKDGVKVVERDQPDYRDLTDELERILKECQEYNGTSAVLFRTNKEVNFATRVFHDNGYDTGRSKYAEHLSKVFRAALDDNYFVNYLASCLSKRAYSKFLRTSTLATKYTPQMVVDDNANNTYVRECYDEVRKLKSLLKEDKPIDDIANDISEQFHVSFKGEINSLDDLETALSDYEFKGTIYCGTIHSVKGLEYDNVYVMNVGSRSFTLDNEEMDNLFYVACTRAKERLVVYKK